MKVVRFGARASCPRITAQIPRDASEVAKRLIGGQDARAPKETIKIALKWVAKWDLLRL